MKSMKEINTIIMQFFNLSAEKIVEQIIMQFFLLIGWLIFPEVDLNVHMFLTHV